MESVVASPAKRKVSQPSKGKDMCGAILFETHQLLCARVTVLENALSAVENNTRVKGFYDVTPLAKLPWFDLVLGIVPDYMHGVLLGVTKQLLNLWLSPSRYKKPWFIGNKTKAIDKRLKDMKPPDFIQRLSRELETSRAYFKASELQAWLLYYSIPCLIDI